MVGGCRVVGYPTLLSRNRCDFLALCLEELEGIADNGQWIFNAGGSVPSVSAEQSASPAVEQ